MRYKTIGFWNRDEGRGRIPIYEEPFMFTIETTTATETYTPNIWVKSTTYPTSTLSIDWGDSSTETITADGQISHVYATAGDHQVSISQMVECLLGFSNDAKLRTVDAPIPARFDFSQIKLDLDIFFMSSGLESLCDHVFYAQSQDIAVTVDGYLNMSGMFAYTNVTRVTKQNIELEWAKLGTVNRVFSEDMFRSSAIQKIGTGLLDWMECDNIYMKEAFKYCYSLTEIEGRMFPVLAGGICLQASYLFHECSSLAIMPDRFFESIGDVVTLGVDFTSDVSRSFDHCTALLTTPDELFYDFKGSVISTANMFYFSGLTAITSNFFLNMCNATSQANGFNYLGNTFSGIRQDYTIASSVLSPITNTGFTLYALFSAGLQLSIPADLIKNKTNIISIGSMLQSCVYITSYPAGLLDGMTSLNDVSYLFYNCVGITNAVDDIWNDYPTATHTDCFYGCTNATNYASIPIDWR